MLSGWVPPLIILACGLGVTAISTRLVWENLHVKAERHFTEISQEIERTISTRMEAYVSLLRGGAALFAANQFVTLGQFRDYYQRLQIGKNYPGMQGFGYTARFPSNRVEEVEELVRRHGRTNFAVWPPTPPRAEYHSIVFLEPMDARNQRAIGYDMFTENVRRAAMETARDTGDPVASGKVELVQELTGTDKQHGFLIYVPVYRGGRVPPTIEARREALLGFVYSPFRTGDLMRGIFGDSLPYGIHFSIHDGPAAGEDNLLFSTKSGNGLIEAARGLRFSDEVVIAKRPWTLVFEATPAFAQVEGTALLFVVPLFGVIGTLLLVYFTRSEGKTRHDLEFSSAKLKHQHQWLQVTLSSIGDAVVTTDSAGLVRFMNTVAEQMTGWTRREAEGKLLREVFDAVEEESRQVIQNPVDQVLRAGATVSLPTQTVLIARDGTERCIEDSAAPIRDPGGEIAGVVLVFHDITERRLYERRIAAQHAVANILAESPELEMAAGLLLESIAGHLNYEHGVFWVFDPESGRGRALKIWHLPNVPIESFDQACLSFHPAKGEGLPGVVWEKGETEWVSDFSIEPRFPRADEARKHGIRSAVAFPVRTEGEMFGALEFFSRDARAPDLELRHVLSSLGAQIGQFVRRKKAEQALLESESLYRAISETAADGIVTIDEDSIILTVNEAVERTFGYSREELVGKSLSLLMPPRMREGHYAGMRRFLTTGQKRMSWSGVELPGLRKDGTEIPLEISFGVTRKAGQYLFTGLIRDITRRREAERSLREVEERFSLLVRLAEDYAIIFTDARGRISNWNPGAQRTFEYIEEEVLGRNLELLFTEEDQAAGVHAREMERAAEAGRALDERWHKRKDGSRFFASGTLICLRDEASQIRGFAKILRDITQRKKAEEAIQELNQELENRVQRRTAALQESKEQMEAFTYTVAHDLRAPLRAMQGFSQALVEDYRGSLSDESRNYLSRIMASAEKMDTLIQDLLAYSQLSRSDLKFQRVSVAEAVNNALASAREEIERRDATIETRLDSLFVQAHLATFHHVLANLVSNAIKFAPPDGQPRVRIWAIDQGAYVKISVQDNGIGIAPEHQDRIFRVFERLHSNEEYPGTGIGLAIVKTGVERMGGRIGLISAPGEGSLFWIELPKAE